MLPPYSRPDRRTFRVCALAAIVIAVGGCARLNGNFRTVESGALYRSGQLRPEHLERKLEKHTIRTVVSLRSPNSEEPWYEAELAVCDRLGVAHYDIPWSSQRLPEPAMLEALVRVYETGPSPILVHCQGGTHRAGVASAVYRLMAGEGMTQAEDELDVFFNDAPVGELLDLYAETSKPFAQWVREDYPALYAERADAPTNE